MFFNFIAFVVGVFTRSPNDYVPMSAVGISLKKAAKALPFRSLGHSFALKRNVTLDPATENDLTARGYSVMTMNKRTIFMKESATADDYVWVDDHITAIDNTMITPNRFLSHQQFYGYRILLSVTSAICMTLFQLAQYGEEERYTPTVGTYSVLKNGHSVDGHASPSTMISTSTGAPEFEQKGPDSTKEGRSSWASFLKKVVHLPDGLGTYVRGVVINPFVSAPRVPLYDIAELTPDRHGIVCPFRQDLSLPDPSMITDTIATYFRPMLGLTPEEQMESLQAIRIGAGGLRFTRLGDELSHLYKCIEICLRAQCGLLVAFSGTTYDGAVLQGGTGAALLTGSRVLTFDKLDQVKKDFDMISVHRTALKAISDRFPTISRASVLAVKSMVELRRLCISNSFTQDQVSEIMSEARGLDFGEISWQVTPDRLAKCFDIMTGTTPLTPDVPLASGALFSKDMVTVALSVFGNDGVPSWNIPSGTLRKLTGKASPSPPQQSQQRNLKSGGGIDDGAWVMETRGTKLENAAEDFRTMSNLGGYRSVPSAVAKRQHFKVFVGNRMDVFWTKMQGAYGVANKSFRAEDRDDSATIGRKSPGASQGGPAQKKRRVDI